MEKILAKLASVVFAAIIFCLFIADYAKAVLSIAMIVYTLIAILYFVLYKKKLQWKQTNGLLIFSSGVLLIYLLQYFTSDDIIQLNSRFQIALPLVLLPLSFLVLPFMDKNTLIKTGLVFIGISCFVALGMLYYFFAHYDIMLEWYLQSKVIPGPVNHIRLSLILVSVVLLCYYLIKEFSNELSVSLKYYIIICGVFLFIFIHAYAVRSGLIALYGILLGLSIKEIITKKNYRKVVAILSVFTLFLALILFTVPTLRNKIINTENDITLYFSGRDVNYNSLGTRVISYKSALQTLKEHPLLGCGIGDLQQVNNNYFVTYYPSIQTPIIPHNQFLYYLMGCGLVGVLIFSYSFFAPFFANRNYSNDFLLGLYILLFLSFQTEAMLETQLGVAFTVIFILLGISFTRIKRLS